MHPHPIISKHTKNVCKPNLTSDGYTYMYPTTQRTHPLASYNASGKNMSSIPGGVHL